MSGLAPTPSEWQWSSLLALAAGAAGPLALPAGRKWHIQSQPLAHPIPGQLIGLWLQPLADSLEEQLEGVVVEERERSNFQTWFTNLLKLLFDICVPFDQLIEISILSTYSPIPWDWIQFYGKHFQVKGYNDNIICTYFYNQSGLAFSYLFNVATIIPPFWWNLLVLLRLQGHFILLNIHWDMD